MRTRLLKPGFFQNETLGECTMAARLFFLGLILLADREGRVEYRAKRLAAQIFPYDRVDVEKLTAELIEKGFVSKYVSDGQDIISVLNFSKHQTIHPKEPKSLLPPPLVLTGRDRESPGKPGKNLERPESSSCPLSLSVSEPEVVPGGESERGAKSEPTPTPAPVPVPAEIKIKFAERIALTQREYDGLVSMFGPVPVAYYIPVLSDWLANGKPKKDHAAFIRNWIRKDQAEGGGFFATKRNGFKDARERQLEREAGALQAVEAVFADRNRRAAKDATAITELFPKKHLEAK